MARPPPPEQGCDVLTLVTVAGARTDFDYAINGRPLSQIIQVGGLHGRLGTQGAAHDRRAARQLLLREPSDLPSGRVPLYVCELCADLGCGCIAVRVTLHEDHVVWSSLCFATNHEATDSEDHPALEMRDLYFDREQYTTELNRFG
jgi:hypothetical protein